MQEGPAQVTVRDAYFIIPGRGLTPIFHVVHDELNGRVLDRLVHLGIDPFIFVA